MKTLSIERRAGLADDKTRLRVSSGTHYERTVGYSRAVRVGEHVFVSGTTSALPGGGFAGEGDAYAQTVQILSTIEAALEKAGASLTDIVRYRVYLTRIEDTPEVSRALFEVFGQTRPANTLLSVRALADPRMLVEIDADAVIGATSFEDAE